MHKQLYRRTTFSKHYLCHSSLPPKHARTPPVLTFVTWCLSTSNFIISLLRLVPSWLVRKYWAYSSARLYRGSQLRRFSILQQHTYWKLHFLGFLRFLYLGRGQQRNKKFVFITSQMHPIIVNTKTQTKGRSNPSNTRQIPPCDSIQ